MPLALLSISNEKKTCRGVNKFIEEPKDREDREDPHTRVCGKFFHMKIYGLRAAHTRVCTKKYF